MSKTSAVSKAKTTTTTACYAAVGRRKSATARVRILRRKDNTGNHALLVNARDIKVYLPHQSVQNWALAPLMITDLFEQFDIKVNVCGGGVSGQAGAIRLGIARALVAYNEDLRSVLRKAGCLTRDAREVERKKFGLKKARKNEQYSKR
jgi:small subunit ribosomal protein S9